MYLWIILFHYYGVRNLGSILGSWALQKSFILLSSSSRIYFKKENVFFRIVYFCIFEISFFPHSSFCYELHTIYVSLPRGLNRVALLFITLHIVGNPILPVLLLDVYLFVILCAVIHDVYFYLFFLCVVNHTSILLESSILSSPP